jgi:hypothetical protein
MPLSRAFAPLRRAVFMFFAAGCDRHATAVWGSPSHLRPRQRTFRHPVAVAVQGQRRMPVVTAPVASCTDIRCTRSVQTMQTAVNSDKAREKWRGCNNEEEIIFFGKMKKSTNNIE